MSLVALVLTKDLKSLYDFKSLYICRKYLLIGSFPFEGYRILHQRESISNTFLIFFLGKRKRYKCLLPKLYYLAAEKVFSFPNHNKIKFQSIKSIIKFNSFL